MAPCIASWSILLSATSQFSSPLIWSFLTCLNVFLRGPSPSLGPTTEYDDKMTGGLANTTVWFPIRFKSMPYSSPFQNSEFFSVCYCKVHTPVSYTHLRAHETRHDLVCRLLLEKKKHIN